MPPRSLEPRTTWKKLPWLDGKSSLATSPTASTTPLPLQPSRISRVQASPSPRCLSPAKPPSLSPLSRHPIDAPIEPAPIVRAVIPSPASRRDRKVSHSERRTSSPELGSPAAMARRSQPRHPSVLRYAPPPRSHRPSISHEPRQRLSIVHVEKQEDASDDIRPQADSLAPVPDHLDRFETPNSSYRPRRDKTYTGSSPRIINSVELSPAQPIPRPSAFEKVSQRRLSNTIEGLEDLVQEAVVTANDTTDPAQVEEIYDIIEDARNAIQDASGDPTHGLARTVSPLDASSSSEVISDSSSGSFEESSPQLVSQPESSRTPPAAPIRAHRRGARDLSPLSHPQNVEQRGSEAVDWAYQTKKYRPQGTPSSSSSDLDDSSDQTHSRLSAQSDPLLPPNPVQTSPRDRIDWVLRPARSSSHSRGRPRHRCSNDSESATGKRCPHRTVRGKDDGSRIRRKGKLHRPTSPSESDASFDEEDLQATARGRRIGGYGDELHIRDQARHHTFSLRRYHRRQPIARNWRTVKKRITAVIACINTALLGIIAGIYVSNLSYHEF